MVSKKLKNRKVKTVVEKSTFLKNPIDSIATHVGKLLDRLKPSSIPDIALTGACAYLGYRNFDSSWEWAIAGALGYKLASIPNSGQSSFGVKTPLLQVEVPFNSQTVGLAILGLIGVKGVIGLIPVNKNIYDPETDDPVYHGSPSQSESKLFLEKEFDGLLFQKPTLSPLGITFCEKPFKLKRIMVAFQDIYVCVNEEAVKEYQKEQEPYSPPIIPEGGIGFTTPPVLPKLKEPDWNQEGVILPFVVETYREYNIKKSVDGYGIETFSIEGYPFSYDTLSGAKARIDSIETIKGTPCPFRHTT